jgi:glutaredoxin
MSRTTLLLLLCIMAGLQQNWQRINMWLNPPPPMPVGEERIVLYATTWCGYCAKTRKFFAENQIAYQEWDVENSAEGRNGYRQLGGNSVPIIVVDGSKVIRGYDPESITEALSLSP